MKAHDLETNIVQLIVLLVKFHDLLCSSSVHMGVPIVTRYDLLSDTKELITELDREILIYCEIVVPICVYNGKSLSDVS